MNCEEEMRCVCVCVCVCGGGWGEEKRKAGGTWVVRKKKRK